MSNDWRRLLELSARAEEKYLNGEGERYKTMAQTYLDHAKAMPR